MTTAADGEIRRLIERYNLEPHPEGGWFRETVRSEVRIPLEALPGGYDRTGGDTRCAMTSILFLIPQGLRTSWHRVRSEELFVHHGGDDVRLLTHEPADRPGDDVNTMLLGTGDGARLQTVVAPMWWQAAETARGSHGYALLGCIVAPGFEFADFEMAD